MSYEPVDVIIYDRGPGGDPVPGVKVRLFSTAGLPFGEATTDALGRAAFLLPAPAVYEARFYKFKVDFVQPQLLSVVSGEANRFEVYGVPFVYPQATDPRLCLASGFFRRPDGGVAANVDMHFSNTFQPIVLEGSAVFPRKFFIRTNAHGYAEVHLIRGAIYDVEVEGLEKCNRRAFVPDWPWVNLAHLLLPAVKSVSFVVTWPGAPFELTVGGEVVLRPLVTSTDLRPLLYADDVLWTVSDPLVAELEYGVDALTLRGLRPGSFELRAERRDKSIVYIPNTPIEGAPLAFTVV
jgi:hypothetical protein